jgi:tetratricopeptide (TPR) repeat protein
MQGHDEVRRRMAAKDWNGVLAAAQPLLDRVPGDGFLLLACHRAHLAKRNLVEARDWLERALALDPAKAMLHHQRSLLEQQCGNLQAALEASRRALALAPRVADYHGRQGELLFQLGDYAAARQSFDAALKLDAARDRWWNKLALCALKCDDAAGAVQAYERSLAVRDDFAIRAALLESRRMEEASRRSGRAVRSASPSYYDDVFAQSPRFLKAGAESDYVDVWRRIAALLREQSGARVLDLGCGPGQFGEFIAQTLPGIDYTGVDFSVEAIAQARHRCPHFRFEQAALPDAALMRALPHDIVVCTEVLEHLEDDLEILASVPPGRMVIGSVPNYDSFSHVRSFKTDAAVRARYAPWLEGLEIARIPMTASNVIWLFHGRRAGNGLVAA